MTDISTTKTTGETPMEYAGDVTFGPPQGGPSVEPMSHEAWMERAHAQWQLMAVSLPIVNGTDADVEAMMRSMIDKEGGIDKGLEPYKEMIECLGSNIETYQAGVDVFTATKARLFIVFQRIIGRDEIEAAYRENKDHA